MEIIKKSLNEQRVQIQRELFSHLRSVMMGFAKKKGKDW
jgi:hypothetical protein